MGPSPPRAPKAPLGPLGSPWVPLGPPGSPYWVPWAQCPGKVGMTKLPLESLVEEQALPERVSQVGGTARERKELYFGHGTSVPVPLANLVLCRMPFRQD